MNYLFFSTLAAILFAATTIVSKLLAKHKVTNSHSLLALTLLSYIPGLLLLYALGPISITQIPSLPLLIYSMFFVGGLFFFTKALFTIDASVIAPVFQLQSVFVVLLSVLFLNEHYSLQQYGLIALTVGGAILVTFNEHLGIQGFLQKGIVFLLAQQFLHAISNIYAKFSMANMSFWMFIFWGYSLNVLLGLLFLAIAKPSISYPKPVYGMMIIRSSLQLSGAVALFWAFQENVAISTVIGLMSAPIVFLVSVLASRFYPTLLEHHSLKVYLLRGVGLAVILTGVIGLALR